MNHPLIIFTALLLGTVTGCGPVRTPSEQELMRVWSAPNTAVEERAAAVNQCFTNGTPISSVISLLGTNYTRFTLVATYWCGESKLKNALDLTYDFGEDSVVIKVTSDEHAEPLAGEFTGARFTVTKTNLINVQ